MNYRYARGCLPNVWGRHLFCGVTLPHPKGSGGFSKGKTLDFWAPGKLHNFDLCCFDVLTCEFSGFLAVTILTLVGNNVKIAT